MPAAKGIGRLIQFGIAKETTRGTVNAAAEYWLPWSEHSIDEKDARVPIDMALGVIEDGSGEMIAKQWAEASVKAPVDDTILPLFLISLLGTNTPAANSDPSGIVYNNTITVAQTPIHQSLSLYTNDDLSTADYKYALGVCISFELNYMVGKFVEFNAKLKCKKGASTTNTPANTTINRFLGHHMTFKVAANLAGLTAASAVTIRSAKLLIQNNIEDDHNLGSLAPTDFVNKQFKITGEFELCWVDETYKTIAIAGTSKALRFDLINTDVTIGTSANPELRIDLANAIFGQPTRAIKLNDMVIQTIPFTAYYSTGDSKMVTILATNLKNGY